MQIELLFLACIFLVIIILLALKRPLWQAIAGGLVFVVILYRIPPMESLKCISRVLTNWNYCDWNTTCIQYTFWRSSTDDAPDVHVPRGKSDFSHTHLCGHCSRTL